MSKEDTNTKENINIKTKDELQINHLNDFLNEYKGVNVYKKKMGKIKVG